MANKNKAKGTLWERNVRDFFRKIGFVKCDRAVLTGGDDRGDLLNLPRLAVECRDQKTITWSKNVEDARSRADVGDMDWGVAIVKRRQKSVEQAYAVMDLETFGSMYQAALAGAEEGSEAFDYVISVLEEVKAGLHVSEK